MPFPVLRTIILLAALVLSSCSRSEQPETPAAERAEASASKSASTLENASTSEPAAADQESRMTIQVFYKEQPPSLQTHERVKAFLDAFQGRYEINYLLMTEPDNQELMLELGLPTEHFPFGIAIDGKTSARIDDETIVFAHFPDFMHHVGRHPGNWTLAHLERVLEDPELLLADNPAVETRPGGGQRTEGRQEAQQ